MTPHALTRLVLTDFRNYTYLKIDADNRPVVLTGANGSGKTNLLEAISFLSPGRGLRRATVTDPCRTEGPGGWAVSGTVWCDGIEQKVGTGLIAKAASPTPTKEKRSVRIDGVNMASTNALADILKVTWLTPQMDRLFQEGASGRRRFLDRLTFGFDPAHARRTNLFEKLMRERNRLLKERRFDPAWLNSLEHQMAEQAIAISAARVETTDRLNGTMTQESAAGSQAAFPKARLTIRGTLEDAVGTMPALALEELYRDTLSKNRAIDAKAGTMTVGPHKSDLDVLHIEKQQLARLCSTGEQKALLISIILADARLQAGIQGKAPVLLLDEITAHLDKKRRIALFDEIDRMKMQAWMTGTDYLLFSELGDRAQFFTVDSGTISTGRAN
ncbi:MAG: DNA replication/repair protein RecF [Sneathiella sp.]|nr:DNA replication/repair protein RecF [Sneathiella sp.]